MGYMCVEDVECSRCGRAIEEFRRNSDSALETQNVSFLRILGWDEDGRLTGSLSSERGEERMVETARRRA